MVSRTASVSLPVNLLGRIDKFLNKNPDTGYANRSDLVKEGTRRFLEYLEDRYEPKGRSKDTAHDHGLK